MTKPVRYHIQLNKTRTTNGRTTISMDKIVSDLMAIKLETMPGTRDAHTAVRDKLQQFINHDLNRGGHQLSRYLTKQAILFIADNTLSRTYSDLVFDGLL